MLRLAMWSGPRNISTAMMRSWGNRADTLVCDEPLYAHYLAQTHKDHPGADEVIRHGETDWRKVVAWLTGPIPDGKAIFFQKHMTHHLLPHIRRHTRQTPLVLDAQDAQNRPREVLGLLCDALQVPFAEEMLTWAPGLRPSDGVWAKHWYKEVESSTGFRPYQPRAGELPPGMISLYEQCLACYEPLYAQRLR